MFDRLILVPVRGGLRYIGDTVHEYRDDLIVWETLAIAAFTGTLWWVTWGMVRIAREQRADLLRSVDAAERSAAAAVNTVETMEKIAARQLRAYVGIDRIEIESDSLNNISYEKHIITAGSSWPDKIIIYVRNFGQTTASKVTCYVNWQPMPWPQFLPDNFPFADKPRSIPEGVRIITSEYTLDNDQIARLAIGIEDLSCFIDAHNMRAKVHIYGHVDYSDIYDQRWERGFCFIYEPWVSNAGGRFPPYDKNNYEKQIA